MFIPLTWLKTSSISARRRPRCCFADDASKTLALQDSVKELLEATDTDERYMAIPWYAHNEMMEYLQLGTPHLRGIYLAILLLASFVVVNTFVMIVNERRREIGMLSALGLRPGRIRTLFLLEGGICGLLGSLLGTILGAALVWALSQVGIPMTGSEAMGADIMFPTTLYPEFNPGVLVYAFVGGFLVTVASVYVPARQAARLKPTDALRSP